MKIDTRNYVSYALFVMGTDSSKKIFGRFWS